MPEDRPFRGGFAASDGALSFGRESVDVSVGGQLDGGFRVLGFGGRRFERGEEGRKTDRFRFLGSYQQDRIPSEAGKEKAGEKNPFHGIPIVSEAAIRRKENGRQAVLTGYFRT